MSPNSELYIRAARAASTKSIFGLLKLSFGEFIHRL
jgi:hypothetical protein